MWPFIARCTRAESRCVRDALTEVIRRSVVSAKPNPDARSALQRATLLCLAAFRSRTQIGAARTNLGIRFSPRRLHRARVAVLVS
jgi:hypothetical protein